jgi:hypothetical protein
MVSLHEPHEVAENAAKKKAEAYEVDEKGTLYGCEKRAKKVDTALTTDIHCIDVEREQVGTVNGAASIRFPGVGPYVRRVAHLTAVAWVRSTTLPGGELEKLRPAHVAFPNASAHLNLAV